MKIKNLAAFSGYILLLVLLAGCQKEELSGTQPSNQTLTVRSPNCATDCIEVGETSAPTVFCKYYNNNPSVGQVCASVTNTATSVTWSLTSDKEIFYVNFNGVTYYCNGGVNPKIPAVQPYVITVPVSGLNACALVPGVLIVDKQNCVGPGAGHRLTLDASYSFIGLCVENEDLCNIEAGDYTTFTQGFYLQAPPGELYLTANWGTLGPVEIGCGENTTTYSDPASVYNLVAGNNQGQNFRNQLISLTLNSRISDGIGCLRVLNGAFAGMTVDEILALANDVYGGCHAAVDGLEDIIDAINNNFDNGNSNDGVLTCCE